MMTFKSVDDLKSFIANNLITTQEAADILGCKRQNIDYLVSKEKLIPVKQTQRDKLFWKEDVTQRKKAKEE